MARAQHGEFVDWTVTDYLLAAIRDEVAVANWQRSADGHKGRNFPKPTYRPGQKPPDDKDKQTFGKGARTFAEIDALFASIQKGGDDVSPSKSRRRTSPSSRALRDSKPRSPKNSPPSPA